MSTILDTIKTANSNLLRNKIRTFLTILAIFIGSFSIILNSAISTGVNSFIDRQVESFGGDGYMEVMPAALMETVAGFMSASTGPVEYRPGENSSDVMRAITPEMLEQAREIPGITSIDLVFNASAEYVTSTNTDKKFKLRINPLPSNTINLDLSAGAPIDANTDEFQIALTPGFSEALGFSSDEDIIGQTIQVAVKDVVTSQISEVDVTVVAIQAPSVVSMGRSWISPALNTHLYNIANINVPAALKNSSMMATAEFDATMSAEQISEMRRQLTDIGLSAMTVDDMVGQIKVFFDIIITVFTIFGGIALLAASIGIVNTLFMSVQERTREIGLDKALGMSSGKVFLSFSLEAIMLGFWGSLLGITLSTIVGFAANNIFHQPGGFLADFPTFNLVEFTVLNCAVITFIIMLIAFLAGTLPARKAAAKNPIDALRYE